MIAWVLLAGATLLAAFFTFVYSQKRQGYLLIWSSAWALVALHSLGPVLEPWLGHSGWLAAVDAWVLAAASSE